MWSTFVSSFQKPKLLESEMSNSLVLSAEGRKTSIITHQIYLRLAPLHISDNITLPNEIWDKKYPILLYSLKSREGGCSNDDVIQKTCCNIVTNLSINVWYGCEGIAPNIWAVRLQMLVWLKMLWCVWSVAVLRPRGHYTPAPTSESWVLMIKTGSWFYCLSSGSLTLLWRPTRWYTCVLWLKQLKAL